MKKIIGLVIAMLMLGSCIVIAAVPRYGINIQGRLTDASNKALANKEIANFKIYDMPQGGRELVMITPNPAISTNDQGFFNYEMIINDLDMPDLLNFTTQLYVEVAIIGAGNNFLALPRQPLTSAPYAIRAKYADDSISLGGIPAASYVQKDAQGNIVGAEYVKKSGDSMTGTLTVDAAGKYAVKAHAHDESGSAVFAYNTQMVAGVSQYNGTGITGKGKTGIFGEGAIGVQGKGGTMGGSFESLNGIGVQGKGGTAGGSFESLNGKAVSAKSINDVAVFADGKRGGISALSSDGIGIQGISNSSNDAVYGRSSLGGNGVHGSSSGNGVYGESSAGVGVYGQGVTAGGSFESVAGVGVKGASSLSIGVSGSSATSYGVLGQSTSAAGVAGFSSSMPAVYGSSDGSDGVYGTTTAGENKSGVRGDNLNGVGVKGVGLVGGSFEGRSIGVYGSSIAAGNMDSAFKVKLVESLNVPYDIGYRINIGRGLKIFAMIPTVSNIANTEYYYQTTKDLRFPNIEYDSNTGEMIAYNVYNANANVNIRVLILYK